MAVADFFSPANPSLVTIHGPFTGRVDDPSRRVGFKRSFSYPKLEVILNPFRCVTLGEPVGGPSNSGHLISLITSIALVGPDDKTPEDAMFPPPAVLPGVLPRRLITLPPRIP